MSPFFGYVKGNGDDVEHVKKVSDTKVKLTKDLETGAYLILEVPYKLKTMML